MTAALQTRARRGMPGSRRALLADGLIVAAYLAAAVLLYGGLWADLDRGYLTDSGQDQNLFEWFFAVQAHALAAGENPLFSALQHHPLGVNLMANTAMPGLAIPLAPVTWLLGTTATWAVILTGGLAGTATAWYWLLSRHLVASRLAAAIGGAFCAFAPPIISHAKAHPNFAALFVIPLILLQLIRLYRGQRAVPHGILLGLLIAYQILLGEEALLIAATALGVYAIGYAVARPAQARAVARPMLTGLGVAAGLAAVLVAYPLWFQFFGPQSYRALEHGEAGNDLAAFVGYSSQSLAGDPAVDSLAMNPTEENAFFGWPLVILVVLLAVWLWRDLVARLAAIVALVMAVLSLGIMVTVDGGQTPSLGPWILLSRLPLYESLLESRLALGCVPAIGILLALGTQRILLRSDPDGWGLPLRLLWFGALTAALLPILPMPFQTDRREDTPALIADGGWRRYVEPGGSVVPVPLPDAGNTDPLRWQIDAGLGFPLPEGYFVGPTGPDQLGAYGARPRPTSSLLDEVADKGVLPRIGLRERAQARADLRFWHADVVVLPEHSARSELRQALDLLIGPGRQDAGMWVWDVRAITR